MDAEELSRIVGGRLLGKNLKVRGFNFDSREIEEGEVFVPLVGKRDGHDFISHAFERGAPGVISSKDVDFPSDRFSVLVSDTYKAFKRVARWRRERFSNPVVAVTGSVGKTTTKELLSFVLSKGGLEVYRNKRSFNNELGLIHTLSNLLVEADIYVQEVGTNSPGEIPRLREFLKPSVGIVTAVERAHMEGFGSLAELIAEKFSITEGTDVSIVPHDLSHHSLSRETVTFGKFGDVRLTSFETSPSGTKFEISVFGRKLKLETEVPGFSVVNSTLVCGALLSLLGLPLELLESVRFFKPPSLRMEIYRFKEGVLIDDSYNANPASFRNGLFVLSHFPGERVVVAGDMLELGKVSEEEHRKLGKLMNEFGVSVLIAFGKEIEKAVEEFCGESYYFTDRGEFVKFILNYDFTGKAVLVKGSRSNRLDEISEIIRKRLKG